jgi:hypothetical protein
MRNSRTLVVAVAAFSVASLLASVRVDGQQKTVQIPDPGRPQIQTMEGKFVRAAYNNEAYVILGYQVANRTIGSDWLMLDVGMTLMEKVKAYTLKRDDASLDTPDAHIALASIEEYRQNSGTVQMLQQRLATNRDSINYYPPWTHRANRLGFFSDLGSRALPWDQVEVRSDSACTGQLYFHVPGGTKYGQYWLNIKFAQSEVRVPFRLLTEEEEKFLGKNFGDIKKQVDNAFRQKK